MDSVQRMHAWATSKVDEIAKSLESHFPSKEEGCVAITVIMAHLTKMLFAVMPASDVMETLEDLLSGSSDNSIEVEVRFRRKPRFELVKKKDGVPNKNDE